MRLVSFNVNSVRIRLHQLAAVIEKHDPEFIGLQETKVQDHEFPEQAINDLGYHVEFTGQKTHYGVALLSKQKPINVSKGFAGDKADSQKRFVLGEFETSDKRQITIINGYFPQGENRSHELKFPAKEKYYQDLQRLIESDYKPDDLLIIMGDMNIAPVDNDIGIGEPNMKRWLKDGKTSFLPEERAWFQRLIDWGLVDTYRANYPEVDDVFSWFDYRSKGFEREPRRGLRIDMILASKAANQYLVDAGVDYDVRAMDKPSDHCPIWTELSLS